MSMPIRGIRRRFWNWVMRVAANRVYTWIVRDMPHTNTLSYNCRLAGYETTRRVAEQMRSYGADCGVYSEIGETRKAARKSQ